MVIGVFRRSALNQQLRHFWNNARNISHRKTVDRPQKAHSYHIVCRLQIFLYGFAFRFHDNYKPLDIVFRSR